MKPHYCNKTLDTAYITWIRAIQLTYLNNKWTSSDLLGSSIWNNTVIYFLVDLESKWQAGLAECTVFWCKQSQCIPLRTTKNIVCFWILKSSRSGKHLEGHIRQGLNLWMLCKMNDTPWWNNTPSKKFCTVSSKMQIFLPLILSPLVSLCRSTCRGQSTFYSPEISTKKPAVIWMRVVCKNLLFPTTWKHCLLDMYFTDEAHEGVLPSMYGITEIAFWMRHTVAATIFLKHCSQTWDCAERNHNSDFSAREDAAPYNMWSEAWI